MIIVFIVCFLILKFIFFDNVLFLLKFLLLFLVLVDEVRFVDLLIIFKFWLFRSVKVLFNMLCVVFLEFVLYVRLFKFILIFLFKNWLNKLYFFGNCVL